MSRRFSARGARFAIILLTLAAGCFRHPGIDGSKLRCVSSDNCLPGYHCTRQGDSPTMELGSCVKSDGSLGDTPSNEAAEVPWGDAAPAIDGRTGSDWIGVSDGATTTGDLASNTDLSPEHALSTKDSQEDAPLPTTDGSPLVPDGQSFDKVPPPPDSTSIDAAIAETGGVPGTGGIGGAGGVTGASGSGGAAIGSGGRTGSGGATTGSGGRTGSGGAITGSGGSAGSGGTTGTGGTSAAGNTGSRPCDIYAAANNTCVAAHSTVRALFASYGGPLYQVRRASDQTTADIGVLSPGGLADAAAQDSFCAGTTCVIVQVYDQTTNANHIGCQSSDGQCPNQGKDSPASATNESLNVGGQKVYALKMKPANAYWRDASKSGMPLDSSPQGIYMVTSGKYYNGGCCFDYGNAPTSRQMSGGGTMDALYFGNSTIWGSGDGTGPWVMADFEGGLYAQGSLGRNNNVLSLTSTYVTAVEKNNGTSEFSLRGGDATTGNLSTFYKGSLPAGYSPMKKQGAIILGSGGDCCYSNSNASQGTLYEGAIVSGYPSDATDDAIQANIISAGYGK